MTFYFLQQGLVIVLIILTCLQILISLPLSMLNYKVDDKNIHWVSTILGRMRMISTISLNEVVSDFFFFFTFGKMNKNINTK